MSIVIRIKRRIPVGAGSQLKKGELAYSEGSGTLYIGNDAETVNLVIGGDFFANLLTASPGVATADKAVILDSSTEIDSWNVAGLLTADSFKTSAAVAAGFVKNDGSGNFLFGQTGEQSDLFLDNLADVTITSETLGDFLRFDGSVFVNTPLSVGDLPTHTHVEADITDLQTYLLDITGESIDDLSDVDTTGIATGKHLIFNGTNWVPVANDLIGLADTPPDYSGAGLLFLRVDSGVSFVEFVSISLSDLPSIALDDLANVAVSSPTSGDHLEFDGSDWIAAVPSGVSELDDLSDVTLSNSGEFGHLEFDGSQWKNVQDLTINAFADAQLNFDNPIAANGWNFRTSANRLLFSRGLPIGNVALALSGNTSGSSDIFELDSSVTGEITLRPAPFLGSNTVSTDVDVHFETRGTGQFFFDAAGAGNVVSSNGYETSDTSAYYLGDPAADGTWRLVRNGSDLEIQVRVLGTYIAKTTITP